MKAILVREFGPPAVLKVEELPNPSPGPGEVLVRAQAVGVNPVDTYIRSGGRGVALPYVPGSDASGTVEAVGTGVTQFTRGDRVYTSGTASGGYTGAYAELVLAKVSQVHALPGGISFLQGAAVNIPYATAYRALVQRARASAAETVLVHGASGGVGVAAVQIARSLGMTVIGTAGTDRGRNLVLSQGAHHALDHRQAGYLEKLLALTGGRGPDVILEMLSDVNLGKDLGVLAPGGRVVVIGCRGTVQINPRETMNRDAAILGMMLANASEAEFRSIHAALFAGMSQGTLKPVVGREFPLPEAPRAHEAVMEPGAYGKIVLVP